MKRYLSKASRRYGENLLLKGERDLGPKAAIRRRPYAPGMHGKRMRRLTSFGKQLAEKQKLRIMYGLTERQFRNLVREAGEKSGPTPELVVSFLERRLDNVLYRLGYAQSRAQARQIVAHGHVLVNGRTAKVPSRRVKPGETIVLKERIKKSPLCKDLAARLKNFQVPAWLELKRDTLEAKVLGNPKSYDTHVPVNVPLVIEFYSR